MKKSIRINALFSVIRQCASVLLPLLTYPYISRILGSENLGRYSFADSVIQYFMILSGLGIATYGVREGSMCKDEKNKFRLLVSQLFTINVISTIFSLVILYICVVFIPRFNQERYLITLLSVNVVSYLLGRDWINTVFEDFRYLSVRYIAFSIVSFVLIFLTIKKPEDIYLYACICVFSASGGYLTNIFYTRRIVPYGLIRCSNVKIHIKPIILLFCSSIAINIYIHSDITILGFFRSNSEIGYYSAASKIYITIKGVLNAIIAVTIPRLANYLGNHKWAEYNSLLNKLRTTLYTLIIPSIVGLYMLSSDIIVLVGGDEYIEGANSLKILCAALFFAVFGCFYTQGILVPNRKEKVFTYATVISAIINITLNLCLIPIMGIDGAAITTLLAEILIFSISAIKSRKDHIRFNNKPILFIIIGCVAIVIACWIVKNFHFSLTLEVLSCVMISVIVYSVVLYFGKNEFILFAIIKIKQVLKNALR